MRALDFALFAPISSYPALRGKMITREIPMIPYPMRMITAEVIILARSLGVFITNLYDRYIYLY